MIEFNQEHKQVEVKVSFHTAAEACSSGQSTAILPSSLYSRWHLSRSVSWPILWILWKYTAWLLAKHTNCLQVVINKAARPVTADTGKNELHIIPALRDIHPWLSVQLRIVFKCVVLAYNCVRDTGHVLVPITSMMCARHNHSFLDVPVFKLRSW